MTSPTQRSLAEMRRRGCELVQVVEKWNAFAQIRQDLFGFVDILCIHNGDTIAVQCTSGDHLAERVGKILASDALPHLRKAGWTILCQGWRKVGPRGKRKTWEVREVDLSS